MLAASASLVRPRPARPRVAPQDGRRGRSAVCPARLDRGVLAAAFLRRWRWGDDEQRTTNDERPISIGAKVRLKNFGSIGTVEKIQDGEAEVLVGVMRLREKVENLETISEEKPQDKGRLERLQEKSKKVESNLRFEEENRNAELNLVGKRVDEAEDLLDKFLDNSYLSGFQRVRVIHGIGTGALRNAVHSFLKGHPHVSRYTLAAQHEGGNGATVVEMKK